MLESVASAGFSAALVTILVPINFLGGSVYYLACGLSVPDVFRLGEMNFVFIELLQDARAVFTRQVWSLQSSRALPFILVFLEVRGNDMF